MTAVRQATEADTDAVVDTITSAFAHDPLWGPAFGGVPAYASALWRMCVTGALRYPWVLVTENVEAAAVWIPPGGTEFTPAQEAAVEGVLTGTAGPEIAAGVLGIFDKFAEAHPHEPHYYLSLLGTHDRHRGHGTGIALLAASLERIDREHMPAYLESSNPAANDARYARLGFRPVGEIVTASGHRMTTMWRDAR